MIKKICQVCGKEFQVKPSYFKKGSGKYCSHQCYWSIHPKIKIICQICNKEFWVRNCRENIAKYCSRKCFGKIRSITMKGKNNPFYGKKHTKKSKEKISKSRIGRIPWNKGKPYLQIRGEKNPRWKGGKTKLTDGHILLLKPNHPFCDYRSYIRQSHLIMEKHVGRYLKPKEVVHHINGNPSDDRIENLMLFPNNSEHMKFHQLNK